MLYFQLQNKLKSLHPWEIVIARINKLCHPSLCQSQIYSSQTLALGMDQLEWDGNMDWQKKEQHVWDHATFLPFSSALCLQHSMRTTHFSVWLSESHVLCYQYKPLLLFCCFFLCLHTYTHISYCISFMSDFLFQILAVEIHGLSQSSRWKLLLYLIERGGCPWQEKELQKKVERASVKNNNSRSIMLILLLCSGAE